MAHFASLHESFHAAMIEICHVSRLARASKLLILLRRKRSNVFAAVVGGSEKMQGVGRANDL